MLIPLGAKDLDSQHPSPKVTIHTKIITNKNLEICFRIRFRNGKANKFPQIFFRICFRNDHVGHAQATTAGHAYKIK